MSIYYSPDPQYITMVSSAYVTVYSKLGKKLVKVFHCAGLSTMQASYIKY